MTFHDSDFDRFCKLVNGEWFVDSVTGLKSIKIQNKNGEYFLGLDGKGDQASVQFVPRTEEYTVVWINFRCNSMEFLKEPERIAFFHTAGLEKQLKLYFIPTNDESIYSLVFTDLERPKKGAELD